MVGAAPVAPNVRSISFIASTVLLLLVPSALASAQLPVSAALSANRGTDVEIQPDDLINAAAPLAKPTDLLQPAPGRVSWWAPALSVLVPGSGQAVLKQQRSVAYVVLEGYLLLQAVSARNSGNRDRSGYQQVAAENARSRFGGQLPVGDWRYYEAMQSFLESGVYNSRPDGQIAPENDVTTFNGAQWLLARETFWNDPDVAPESGSPEYQRAVEFYQQRAFRDEFRWSWRDARLVQDVYRQRISSANKNYQRAVNYFGVVAANHLLSMVDAFVSVKLLQFAAQGGDKSGEERSNADNDTPVAIRSNLRVVDGPLGKEIHPSLSVSVPLPRQSRR